MDLLEQLRVDLVQHAEYLGRVVRPGVDLPAAVEGGGDPHELHVGGLARQVVTDVGLEAVAVRAAVPEQLSNLDFVRGAAGGLGRCENLVVHTLAVGCGRRRPGRGGLARKRRLYAGLLGVVLTRVQALPGFHGNPGLGFSGHRRGVGLCCGRCLLFRRRARLVRNAGDRRGFLAAAGGQCYRSHQKRQRQSAHAKFSRFRDGSERVRVRESPLARIRRPRAPPVQRRP